MSGTPKKKLCWNCDGNVALNVLNCPYCGVYLERTTELTESEEEEDALSPPYAMVGGNSSQETPKSPFSIYRKAEKGGGAVAEETSDAIASPSLQMYRTVSPLLLLCGGVVFTLFGLALWLFAENGLLTLTWDSNYWMVYLGTGLLFLALGWYFFLQLDIEN